MTGWYDWLRETAERLASWPNLGVALLFAIVLLTRRIADPVVRLTMFGVILNQGGGALQRMVFAVRQWACREVGHLECVRITGDHVLSVVSLLIIAGGTALHFVALSRARGWMRAAVVVVLVLSYGLALWWWPADWIYGLLWPIVRGLAW